MYRTDTTPTVIQSRHVSGLWYTFLCTRTASFYMSHPTENSPEDIGQPATLSSRISCNLHTQHSFSQQTDISQIPFYFITKQLTGCVHVSVSDWSKLFVQNDSSPQTRSKNVMYTEVTVVGLQPLVVSVKAQTTERNVSQNVNHHTVTTAAM